MSNIIAVIWDFDRTLVDGYMQDPIFRKYGVESNAFWDDVNRLPAQYREEGVLVNPDTIYLNAFIHEAQPGGRFAGLNNQILREFGKEQKFYNGVPEIFRETKELVANDPACAEYGIRVEHYIVSTGFAQVIQGSEVAKYVDGIWGCHLIENTLTDGSRVISEIGYTIDNTTKTRAIFEINKGVNKAAPGDNLNVNTSIPEEKRRVHMNNMIYIADGPSDVPAFSVVHRGGGATFAIYPRGDAAALRQVEQMRKDERVDMYAEADYSDGTTANMWIRNKITEMADRIRQSEHDRLTASLSGTPRHLHVGTA